MIPIFLRELEALFGWLLAASWQASVLALLVLLLQRTLHGWLNPRWRYALWLLVLARLVLPALPESALSLFQFAPPPPTALEVSVTEPLFVSTPLTSSQPEASFPEPGYPFSAYTLLSLGWLTGAILLLMLTWQVNRRFARQVADSPEITDPELRKLFATTKAELGVRRSIRLIESGQVQSPAIMGLFQPTLLLPADVRNKFDATELRLIFLHELAHLKRGDVIAQGLIALLQILHWFNPVLWLAFRRMRIDREPATDALVLSRAGEEEKERYGLMLIKLLEHFNQRHSLPTLVGILEDKDQFKRRFSLIARFTRGAYGWSLLGVFVIGVLAAACLTKSKEKDAVLTTDANTKIIEAVQNDDAASLQKLLDQGVKPDNVKDHDTPLLFLARSPEVAETLLAHGADPNARDKTGDAALTSLCRNGGKNAAALASVLLKHGADPNVRVGEFKETPLMDAQDGATVDALVENGADLKAKNAWDEDALVTTARSNVSCLEALVRHGAFVDTKTDGPTMLLQASWANNIPVVKWLLEHGVDPNTFGFWAKNEAKPDHPYTMLPMQAAAVSGHVETAKLLLEHGAKADDQMIAALHNGHGKIVKLLWEGGVRNISELCYAVSQGTPIGDVQKLLDKGIPADPPQDKLITPLGEAAKLGSMDAVQLLVAHHADVNAGGPINPKIAQFTRMSPLWLASSEGQDEIVAYLLQHGATPDPAALWQATENSSPYSEQRSKDHFEKTVRILIDAGALKTVSPELAGMIVSAPIQTRHGPPNATVLKMLLDAGLSPEASLPYVEENGEKGNSVIGYFRYYYQKYKDHPVYGQEAATIKPLLDMLEAADKGATPKADAGNSTKTTTATDTDAQMLEDIQKGYAAALKKLLDEGVDPNRDKSCPVYWAVYGNQPDVLRVLLSHNAETNRPGPNGETPLDLARKSHEELVPILQEGIKFQSIRVDRLTFKDTPLNDVIGALQQKSKQADPDGQGLSFIARTTRYTRDDPTNPISRPSPTITLTLTDVSLAEAVQVIAKAAKFQYSVEEYAVYLRPADDEEMFTVRTFLVPIAFFQTKSGTTVDVKQELIGRGIEFSRDATVTFIPGPRKLVVRDTPEHLDKIVALLDAQERQDAKFTAPSQGVTIRGTLGLPDLNRVDLAKSTGSLSSLSGHRYDFTFQTDGSFVIPHVEPGFYERTIHFVQKAPAAAHTPESLDSKLAPIAIVQTADGNFTMPLEMESPFKEATTQVLIELKIVEIPDDVYQAHRAVIDKGVEKGDAAIFALFNTLRGVDMLAAPSVTTQPGLKANIDIVREFPYPTSFENGKTVQVPSGPGSATNMTLSIPPTPREFVTKDVGVSAEITPTLDQDKIVLNGKFSVVDFEGFTKSNLKGVQMPSFRTSESMFLEALDDKQLKGIWIPGVHFTEMTVTDKNAAGKTLSVKTETVKKRMLLFVYARLVK